MSTTPSNPVQSCQPKISDAAMALLQELSVVPQVVGYDHRISELDKARLIEWRSGEGYFISKAGRAVLEPKGAAV